MEIFINPPRRDREALCRRGGTDNDRVLDTVEKILEKVKSEVPGGRGTGPEV